MTRRPSLTELTDEIRENLFSGFGIDERPRFSVISVLASVLAAVFYSFYSYVDILARNLLPDSAKSEILNRWAAIYGVSRKAASPSTGQVIFRGVDSAALPNGIALRSLDNSIFITTEGGRIEGGELIVSVRSETRSGTQNFPAGTPLSLQSPIAGVRSQVRIASGGVSGGADQESDTSLRARLLSRIRNPPQGGASYDYINWALEIPGVTRAWVFPAFRGPGTVGVSFVLDNQPDIIPSESSEVFRAVDKNIQEKKPIRSTAIVFSPNKKLIEPQIRLIPDSPAIRTEVTEELKDLFFRLSEVGGAFQTTGVLPISKIREAISTAEGENDHELVSPTKNIEVDTGEIAVLGDITWL